MNRINHIGDWGSYNAVLGDKRINDGDVIIVKWPDGHLEQIAVTVETTYGSVFDHGHESPTICKTAYYITQHRGVRIAVPLDDLEAQWV